MKVAALIPARKGSKGIPNKNFKEFCGKPLFMWTQEAAEESGIFDRIILSTDAQEPKWEKMRCKGGENDHAVWITDNERPWDMCTDNASLDDVLKYYQEMYPEIDVWCLLQPTSPLRTAEDIKAAWAMMCETEENGLEYKYDSLVSVTPHPVLAWIDNSVGIPGVDHPQAIATYRINKRPNRQDRKDWYLENGAIYFTRKYVIEHAKCRIHGFIGLYVMPQQRSYEIDNDIDWDVCQMLMERRNGLA
jgi:CMP-N,N'-diacetyllegionaminic acid synthase